MTLLYPKWVLGTHAPAGMLLSQFAGLMLFGNGHRLEWKRDPLDAYAFHFEVPAVVATLNAEFQFLSPVESEQGAIVATPEMLALHWEAMVLYPAGYRAHGIMVRPSVSFPKNWRFAGALEFDGAARGEGARGASAASGASSASGAAEGSVAFKAVDLETLIDSPMYAGKFFRRVDLDPGAAVPCISICSPTARKISRRARSSLTPIARCCSRPTGCSARIISITMISWWR